MRIILDTGAFYRPHRLQELAAGDFDVVIPAVAYMERLRHLVRQGRKKQDFDSLLSRMAFHVEPFGDVEASRLAMHVPDSEWVKLARDAMIAGHIRAGDELWTTNPKDFRRLGVPESQIVAV